MCSMGMVEASECVGLIGGSGNGSGSFTGETGVVEGPATGVGSLVRVFSGSGFFGFAGEGFS